MQAFSKFVKCSTVITFISIFLTLSIAYDLQAMPTNTKIDPVLMDGFAEKNRQIVLVEFKEPAIASRISDPQTPIADYRLIAERLEKLDEKKERLLHSLANRSGRIHLRHYLSRFRMMALELSADEVLKVAAMDDVLRIHADGLNRPTLESSIPFIGADAYHSQGHGGSGVSVAVLDSPARYWNGAFGDCPEAGADGCKIKVWENFTDQDPIEVAEDVAHGSNVSGIVLGIAPEASILSLNVFKWFELEEDHLASNSDIIAALNWVAENREQYNIVAVNMSLGHERESSAPCNDDPRFDPIRSLWQDYGVSVVIASGNDAQTNSLGSPACISPAISVAAQYDSNLSATFSYTCIDFTPVIGKITCFSNLNGALDLVAPGLGIDAGGIESYSGTSMACPHVAGAIALLQSFWKQESGSFKDPAQVRSELHRLSSPLPHLGVVYDQLNMHETRLIAPHTQANFDYFLEENEDGLIPSAPESLVLEAQIESGQSSIDGAYLYLSLIHPQPGNVSLTLTSPDGQEISIDLPAGPTNFNAVLGRDYLPGVFSFLSGADAVGTWTISLQDQAQSSTGDQGYYLSATLWLVEEECQPNCELAECGHDGCGGLCGECEVQMSCSSLSECIFADEFCKGDTCKSAIEIPVPASSTFTADAFRCADTTKASCGGMLAPEKTYTFSLDRPGHLTASVSGVTAVLYLRRDECEGEELACDRPSGGDIPEIDLDLDEGLYYLFVDGYDAGEFQLNVELCSPDCEGKQCGSDGCGGSCGQCDENRSCESDLCVCDFEACDGSCCSEGETCHEGSCCLPDCEGKQCGADGCGGSCGDCGAYELCELGQCICEFISCDEVCCTEGEKCNQGYCCLPDCEGRECGDDYCGGTCGDCGPDSLCENDICIIAGEIDTYSDNSGCRMPSSRTSLPLLMLLLSAALIRRNRKRC